MSEVNVADRRKVALEDVAMALREQLQLLDRLQCWSAAAYLDQAIEAVEEQAGITLPRPTRPVLHRDAPA